MSIKSEIHPLQMEILKILLFKPVARFSELNGSRVPTDQLTFHVKQLIETGYIEKSEEGAYRLTTAGKEFANRLDTDSAKISIEKQAKIGALVGCVRGEGTEREYLMQQRLKQPYYGYYGFITGKVKWGERLEEAAARELLEEANLRAKLTLVGIKHKMDYSPEGVLLEDKYFFVFRAEDPHGEFQESFEGGKNIWLTEQQMHELQNVFDGAQESIDMLNATTLVFSEVQYTVSGF